jgi:FkbM family methyltransferase
MDAKRLRLEHALYGLGLLGPARKLYSFTAGREAKRQRALKRNFFSQLLSPGDLVFDVGANLGSYSEIFASLGARVIALEPNPDCVSHIRRSYPSGLIDVVGTAVGSSAGVATIRLAERSDMSSMSADWIHSIQDAQRMDDSIWAREITVPIITLDSLIARYGTPKFIKIDVEGFEESVLSGLSKQPPILSFEFNTNFLDAAIRCLRSLGNVGECSFNFVIGEPLKFELEEWVDVNQLCAQIHSLEKEVGYGDIFAKLNSANLAEQSLKRNSGYQSSREA